MVNGIARLAYGTGDGSPLKFDVFAKLSINTDLRRFVG
jgi:hypothetical protein